MVDAKQYYDIEYNNNDKQQQIPYDDFVVSFNKVYCDADVLGQQQVKYLGGIEELMRTYVGLKQYVVDMHKQMLASNKADDYKTEAELELDQKQREVDDLQDQMGKQKNKTQLKTL